MTNLLLALLGTLRALFRTQRDLALENLALRQQLAVLRSTSQRVRLSAVDRWFWVVLARCWPEWRDGLAIVTPDTVLRWHRQGFRCYRARKSRGGRPGRPALDPQLRGLIQDMSTANPLWGAPRVHGELMKLGIELSHTTVSKYMRRFRRPPLTPRSAPNRIERTLDQARSRSTPPSRSSGHPLRIAVTGTPPTLRARPIGFSGGTGHTRFLGGAAGERVLAAWTLYAPLSSASRLRSTSIGWLALTWPTLKATVGRVSS